MPKVYNRGVVTKKHGSGMVESDKGFKFPYNKADIGDVMIDVDSSRQIVSKTEYTKTWEKLVKDTQKADEEAAAKALVTTGSTTKTMGQNDTQTTQLLKETTTALIEATTALKEATATASNTTASDASKTTNDTNEGDGNNGPTQQ